MLADERKPNELLRTEEIEEEGGGGGGGEGGGGLADRDEAKENKCEGSRTQACWRDSGEKETN